MSTHKTAALVVTFYDYLLKTSPTGQYYVFKVTDKDGRQDICRSDEIHRSAIEPIFEAIDKGETIDAPVIRDVRHGYRIDLSAVHDFFPRPAKPPVSTPRLRSRSPLPSTLLSSQKGRPAGSRHTSLQLRQRHSGRLLKPRATQAFRTG